MIKVTNKVVLLMSASIISFGCASTNTDTWRNQCETAVKQFTQQSTSNVIYTTLPEVDRDSDFLRLEWSGLSIPIPNTTYQDIVVNYDHDNDLSIILKTTENTRISIGRFYENQEIKSIFEQTGEAVVPTKFAWTTSSLDGSVRTSDLIHLGYQTLLEDIDCTTNNTVDESEKIASLALKQTNNDVSKVHKLRFDNKSWIEVRTHSFDPDSIYYTANIVDQTRNNDEIKQVSYIVPASMSDFKLYAAISDQNPESQNPEWLDALNTALLKNDPKHWLIYMELAETAKISQKSISASKANLLN